MRNALFLMLLLPALLLAEDITPRLEKKEIFLGEPVVLTVPVKPGKEMSAFPKAEDADFAVVGAGPAGEQVQITLSALETGALKTPPVILRVDGAEYAILPVELTVKPNTVESDTHLRDIKPPVKAYEPDHTLLWILGGIILIALLFYLFWRLSKRRRKQELIAVAQKTPYQVAMEYCRRAEQELRDMEFERFADTVTAGIRHYLELQKHRPFLEMTTSEVKRALKNTDLPPATAEQVVALLKEADRFKYADEHFTTDNFNRLLLEFRAIVDVVEKQNIVSTTPQEIKK
ncbi:MAG TPA: hypothetical protein P5077_12105 [bacterium]|nr:hypothetical protein [bacterium]